MDTPGPVINPAYNRPIPVAPPSNLPSRTALLRDVAAALQRLSCLRLTPGEVVQTDVIRIDHFTPLNTLREADPLALKTSVRNNGPFSAKLYESGALVGVVQGNQDIELPERGKLKVQASTTFFTYLVVTTHRRAGCGDVIEFLAPDSEPVGSFLL